MIRQVLQTGLEVEMTDHLGYEPRDPAGRGWGNVRNGRYPKTVATEIGDVAVLMPRDRLGTFEPVTVPKHQRRLDGLAGNVISMYAKGMTDQRRHPSPPCGDLRDRHQPRHDLEDHLPHRVGHGGVAVAAAGSQGVYPVVLMMRS